LDALEKLPRKEGTERPAKSVKITEVIMYVSLSVITLEFLFIFSSTATKTLSKNIKLVSQKSWRSVPKHKMAPSLLPRKNRVMI